MRRFPDPEIPDSAKICLYFSRDTTEYLTLTIRSNGGRIQDEEDYYNYITIKENDSRYREIGEILLGPSPGWPWRWFGDMNRAEEHNFIQ